jgi:hypothetical protein
MKIKAKELPNQTKHAFGKHVLQHNISFIAYLKCR